MKLMNGVEEGLGGGQRGREREVGGDEREEWIKEMFTSMRCRQCRWH